jgi:hypothetical protein
MSIGWKVKQGVKALETPRIECPAFECAVAAVTCKSALAQR